MAKSPAERQAGTLGTHRVGHSAADASPDWRSPLACGRLTCHSQPIQATRIEAASAGGGGGSGCCEPAAELPSPRSSLPVGGAPELRPSRWLRFPRPSASGSASWDAPRRRPELPSLVAPTASRSPPCPFQSHEGGGPGRGSASETGCSRPSPTRCRHRHPWSRPTRTRWTSAPKCSSTGFCGSDRSGDRPPSGPGGE